MRVLVIVVMSLFLMVTVVKAEVPLTVGEDKEVNSGTILDGLKQIPALKQGVGWSVFSKNWNYMMTMQVLGYKGFALEAGYNTEDKFVLVGSMDLLNMKKLGCTVPLLDLVDLRVGGYGGWGHINVNALQKSYWDAGLSVTAMQVKF